MRAMTKRVLVIPDVHGSLHWKACLNKIDDFDFIVQLGDWFDQWHNDWVQVDQIDNLREFIEFKKKYPKKVYALVGNHDLGYLIREEMSGHQKYKEIDIREAMIEFAPYMDIACKIDKYVYSHAGFTKTWMKKHHYKTIEDVNAAFHDSSYEAFRFNGIDAYGDDITQGPTWIRPRALCTDAFFKYQIVGHTEFKDGPVKLINKNAEVIAIDTGNHECLYKIGDEVKKVITAPLYSNWDKVEFVFNKEHKIGIIRMCDRSFCDEKEFVYDIESKTGIEDFMLYKHVEEKNIVKKISSKWFAGRKVKF